MDESKRDPKEEKRFFEKYIKPQYTIVKRIKRKIFGPRKRIKTIDDVLILDYDLFIKLICIMLIYALIRMVVIEIIDVYLWFFPLTEAIPRDPFFIQIFDTRA